MRASSAKLRTCWPALNHPNSAAIYGLEHVDGIRFLVLELVEGPTLARRSVEIRADGCRRSPWASPPKSPEPWKPPTKKGVVHRDQQAVQRESHLRPARSRCYDFGLAKALGDPEPALPAANPEEQSTLTLQETRAGIVLGGGGVYGKSPEQADGKPTDKRSRRVELRRGAV